MFGVDPKTPLSRRAQTLDVYYIVVLLSIGALIPIVLLRPIFTEVPLIPFLAPLLLLMVPGVVLVRWLFEELLEQRFDT